MCLFVNGCVRPVLVCWKARYHYYYHAADTLPLLGTHLADIVVVLAVEDQKH